MRSAFVAMALGVVTFIVITGNIAMWVLTLWYNIWNTTRYDGSDWAFAAFGVMAFSAAGMAVVYGLFISEFVEQYQDSQQFARSMFQEAKTAVDDWGDND